jgi:hypothetical protein
VPISSPQLRKAKKRQNLTGKFKGKQESFYLIPAEQDRTARQSVAVERVVVSLLCLRKGQLRGIGLPLDWPRNNQTVLNLTQRFDATGINH